MRVTAAIGDYLWRPLTDSDSDTDFVLSARNFPRFAPWFYAPPATRETHLAFLERAKSLDDILWIVERDKTPIGISSIYHFDWPNLRAECGRIAMFDGKAFPLNFTICAFLMFEHLGLNKAWIETIASNQLIARGVERLGMTREGVLRDHVRRDGEFSDVLYYGITAADWHGGERARQFERHGEPRLISLER